MQWVTMSAHNCKNSCKSGIIKNGLKKKLKKGLWVYFIAETRKMLTYCTCTMHSQFTVIAVPSTSVDKKTR